MSTKNFIGGSLPLFPIRKYNSIEREGTKTFIISAFEKYILDDTSLPGDYTERRLYLSVFNTSEYRLYPLHKICNTLQELSNSGTLDFINNEGKLLRWNKNTFFPVVSSKVIKSYQLEDGKVEIWYKLPEGGIEKTVASKGYNYVHLIKLGVFCYMPFDFGDTQTCLQRKKL